MNDPAPLVNLEGIGKEYPGVEPSLRGTKLEMQGPALWLRGLVRAARLQASTAPPVRALSAVSLSIAPREVFGILGPNGSGKTTLVKIVAGLLRPTEGTGHVAGIGLDQPQRIRRRVAYASTTGWMGLEWALTAEENIRFFAVLAGMPGPLARVRTEEALHDLGLEQDAAKAVSELSNGMRQRVILARALLFRTPIILLDEPTVGLDPLHREQILQIVRQVLPARGQTVILVDHRADALETVVDRALVLEQGRVRMLGTPAELVGVLAGAEVVELLTRGGTYPAGPAPSSVRRVDRLARPGALGLIQWRVLLDASADGLEAVVRWILSGGGTIVQVAERDPRLADVLIDDAPREEEPA